MMAPTLEPPATIALAVAVVVDAVRRGPFAGLLVLAELGEVQPGHGTIVRAIVVEDDLAVEDDKLEELEAGDRLGNEVSDGPWTGQLEDVAIALVDGHRRLWEEKVVQPRPSPPGHRIGVGGLQPADGDDVNGVLQCLIHAFEASV